MTGLAPGAGLTVTALRVYPVKSLAGVAPESAAVDARGLRGDRRWGIVDPSGEKVTAREIKGLLGLTAAPCGDDGLSIVLSDRAGGELTVDPPRRGTRVPVTHSGQGTAVLAAEPAHSWLSERCGADLRLVWQDDASRRLVRPDLGGQDGDVNSLSDAAPLLVTTDSSLAQLNSWIAESGGDAVDHERFRPNVVVDGAAPFAEDEWSDVTLGGALFRRTMVCDRCVMTTIDRDTLRTTKEPIRTLAKHRKWDGATWFGVRLTPVGQLPDGARISVGDSLVVH